MNNTSRCREKVEGWVGRRRTYRCWICRCKFQVDTLNPLPIPDRICPDCEEGNYLYTFTNKQTGGDIKIKAPNAELATLRAWRINPNLTFKL